MSAQKRHSRNVSDNRIVLPRRNTRDPLGPKDGDPLARPPTLAKEVPTRASDPGSILTEPPKDFSHLLRRENFLPIPTADIPPPFRVPPPDPSTPIPTLLQRGLFRAAATQVVSQLTAVPPPPQDIIFSLLYTRLVCLQLLNHIHIAAQESRNLQDLTSPFYLSPERTNIVPWELRVLAIYLQARSFGDLRKAIMGYYELAGDARAAITNSKTSPEDRALWRTRLTDLGVRVANSLIEMGDFPAAASHLESIDAGSTSDSDRALIRGRLGLLYLRIGNLTLARHYIVDSSTASSYAELLRPLLSIAEGNFGSAAAQMGAALPLEQKEGLLVRSNLAVAMVYSGELRRAREVLEEMVAEGEGFGVLLFNLATIFELCTERNKGLKAGLVETLAGREGGVGGWERAMGEFKL